MDISLRSLQAFVAVARHRSFSRAAGLLHRTQPGLTVQVRRLEEALGLRLLDRLPRGVEPTAAGAELARALEPLLRDVEHALEVARGTASRRAGTVRLAAVPSVASGLLPAAIALLQERHPTLQVRLQEAVTGRVQAMVRGDIVEIGIASQPEDSADLEAEPLFRDRMLAVMPQGHRLATGSVTLERVAAEPLLLMETDTSVDRLLSDAFAARRLPLVARQRAVHAATLINMACAGLGVALLPSTVAELQIAPELVTRRLSPDIVREVVVIRRAGRSYSPAAEALVAALRKSVPRGATGPTPESAGTPPRRAPQARREES
ncbi:LysR family transcriptional regulator [Pararoseomonas indoligenes]|uniref:LysR family transcriptional regulator n=1 Tax=Roseomonas indoligenes TaxID=2820811 RepID=A0A940S9F0_9PROT|nr:LysR family transcriptional regulator [Pararoseomonas indoligenes]MBP0495087.1 LysR family transcriptional regulator [Pararoseomonas indoligenes]